MSVRPSGPIGSRPQANATAMQATLTSLIYGDVTRSPSGVKHRHDESRTDTHASPHRADSWSRRSSESSVYAGIAPASGARMRQLLLFGLVVLGLACADVTGTDHAPVHVTLTPIVGSAACFTADPEP